jgi:diaminohydroxyphosphoribosylaminopyrimidine deaminase / 5-amino-6-(5-phosphoribosylamino)uracil reductase
MIRNFKFTAPVAPPAEPADHGMPSFALGGFRFSAPSQYGSSYIGQIQVADGTRTLNAPELRTVNDDTHFMALALALGRRGLGRTWPNPAVGAVVVRDGIVVGRGWTQPGGRPHAEIEALRRAGAEARGATLYVTLEPCSHHGKSPPCIEAIAGAGVTRVVSALVDPNPKVAGAGHWKLAEQGIVVEVGVGAEEARRAHAGHIRRVQDGRPHVTLKLAVSADDKVALSGRRPAAITSEAARQRTHLMRAKSDALIAGIGTVLADDPQLTCRLPGMPSPVRVLLDGKLRLPLSSRLVGSAHVSPIWICTAERAPAERRRLLAAQGLELLCVQEKNGRLDLPAVLTRLADRGITRLLLEAGPILTSAFLAADLVDEVALFRSPVSIGADGIDALDGLPLSALTQSPRLRQVGSEVLREDVLETFERV